LLSVFVENDIEERGDDETVLLFGVRGNNDVGECGLRPSVLFSVCEKDFEERGDDETVALRCLWCMTV
jgi:hypothetical protein